VGTDDPVAVADPGTTSALVVSVVVVSSLRATFPPAPNSTIPTAQSLHTTKCRHGRRTTSRADVRQTIHSFGVELYGSASPPVGGYEVDVSP
jgi:hypothetical protein